MARKSKGINRRKPSKFPLAPFITVLLVAAGIGVTFFVFSRYYHPAQSAKPVSSPAEVRHLPLPPRTPVQRAISSVSAPEAKKKAAPEGALTRVKGAGSLAIIIDDMGSSTQELQDLLSIKLPLTFSVIPSLAHAKDVAEAAHGAGSDVMIHMPMEPEGYPKQPLERIGLLCAMDDLEISRRVNNYFRSVPFAVGANNHMGSRFTQRVDKMVPVLKALKENGIFFIDSRTSPASVGYRTARRLGVKCAERQVFLDNVQEEGAIRKQLAEAASIARSRGAAIAICHPHSATIRTLQSAMPELARSGISFIYVSRLVK